MSLADRWTDWKGRLSDAMGDPARKRMILIGGAAVVVVGYFVVALIAQFWSPMGPWHYHYMCQNSDCEYEFDQPAKDPSKALDCPKCGKKASCVVVERCHKCGRWYAPKGGSKICTHEDCRYDNAQWGKPLPDDAPPPAPPPQ